ncbi:hypothetical protein GCM10022420_048210 [Streptomyces iranensis]
MAPPGGPLQPKVLMPRSRQFLTRVVLPSSRSPAFLDVRAKVLDLLHITPEQDRRLSGQACARCGATDGLHQGGFAYTASGPDGQGRLGWPVKVCQDCPADPGHASIHTRHGT